MKRRYDGIQILRFALFVGIVAFHCGVPGSQIMWGGVEIFFVISSFFLTKKLSEVDSAEYNIIKMTKHRIGRLAPVYYLVCCGAFVVVLLIKHKLAIKDIVFHILFAQNFNWMVTGYVSDLVPLTGHTWTLSIEVCLFLIWLIAFKVIRDTKKRCLFNCFALFVAIIYRTVVVICVEDAMITSLCPLAHMDAFAVGSLLALSEEAKIKQHQMFVTIAGVLIIILSLCITANLNNTSLLNAYNMYKSSETYLNHPFTCNVYLGFSLVSVGLISLATKEIKGNKFTKIIVLCGSLTYAAYLLHYPITYVFRRIDYNKEMALFVTVIVSMLGANIIEKIMTKIRNGFAK